MVNRNVLDFYLEQLLQDYTLEEILEKNDITELDILNLLVKAGLIELPDLGLDEDE